MQRSLTHGRRRLAAVVAGTLLALGVIVAISTPAQAAPPGCSMAVGHYQSAGNYITGYRFWACDDGDDILLSVAVDRYLSPGVYQTVASGMGYATYHCTGSLFNVYRTTGRPDFAILCS